MKLDLSQIRAITIGAVRVEKMDEGIHFFRFTKAQEELYKKHNENFYLKTFATSGIQLRFRTNSKSLFLSVDVTGASSRNYFSFDIVVNGERIDTLKNFSEAEMIGNYTKSKLPLGNFSKEFCLGTGEKEVAVYFPWSAKAVLKELIIDDGSFAEPIKPTKKMLVFGDSITHGYDALYPSNKYISKLAYALDAAEYNKAIGGEIFFPALAKEKEDFLPDYITVAYGTNDWSKCEKEEMEQNCKAFFENLVSNYPNAEIFAITPIWRKDMNEYRAFGDFFGAGELIQKQAAKFSNITVIRGFEFVPQNENLYADLRLHPNDRGFDYYFENLLKQVNDKLKR